ncbi:MAG: hypothetical protein WCE30_29040 [Mycobacterium sp.]
MSTLLVGGVELNYEDYGAEEPGLLIQSNLQELIQATNIVRVVSESTHHAWVNVCLSSEERIKSITGCVVYSDGGLCSRGPVPFAGEFTA